MSGRIIVFEAGSTKTAVLYVEKNDIELFTGKEYDLYSEHKLPGFNPNRPNETFYKALNELNFKSNDSVFFYGSGLGAAINKNRLKDYFLSQFNLSIHVYDDLIGAARALLGNKVGVLAIMGTGGITAYYDGEIIVDRKGGYGYLLDDIGGGYELGKRIISAWLNNSFDNEIEQVIGAHFNLSKTDFIASYYSDQWSMEEKLKQVARIVKVIQPFKNDENILQLLREYFSEFIEKHLLPLTDIYGQQEVNLIGSVAEAYKTVIQETLQEYRLSLKKVIKSPVQELLKYHFE